MSKTEKTIEQKLTELSHLVAWFQSDDFSLEQAVAKYEAAEKLAVEIENDITQLKNTITVVSQRFV